MKKISKILILLILGLTLLTGCSSNDKSEDKSENQVNTINKNSSIQNDELKVKKGNKISETTEETKTKINTESNTYFKATIIGSGSPDINPERSGPSVLISNNNDKILIDMGEGTQSQLNELDIKLKTISTLLLTHHHIDHNEELMPIFSKLLLGGNNFFIAGPPGTENFITTTKQLYSEDLEYRLLKSERTLKQVSENYQVKDYKGGENFTSSNIKISTTQVEHTIHTIAYRFDVEDKSIVVSGDFSYSPSLIELAKNADILIADSGALIKIGQNISIEKFSQNNKQEKAHASFIEVAQIAEDANVKTLILTHLPNEDIDEERNLEEMAKIFSGEIIFAYDFMEITP
jgi:ribonuclease BN (tRNA processing enzyme)